VADCLASNSKMLTERRFLCRVAAPSVESESEIL